MTQASTGAPAAGHAGGFAVGFILGSVITIVGSLFAGVVATSSGLVGAGVVMVIWWLVAILLCASLARDGQMNRMWGVIAGVLLGIALLIAGIAWLLANLHIGGF